MGRFFLIGFAIAAAAAVYFYWFRRSETEDFMSTTFDAANDMKDNAFSKAGEQYDRAREALKV
jgi:hypothetical protein